MESGGVQAFEREGWPGTVEDEALYTCSVSLYRDLLDHHSEHLSGKPRMALAPRNGDRKDRETMHEILAHARSAREALKAGDL